MDWCQPLICKFRFFCKLTTQKVYKYGMSRTIIGEMVVIPRITILVLNGVFRITPDNRFIHNYCNKFYHSRSKKSGLFEFSIFHIYPDHVK